MRTSRGDFPAGNRRCHPGKKRQRKAIVRMHPCLICRPFVNCVMLSAFCSGSYVSVSRDFVREGELGHLSRISLVLDVNSTRFSGLTAWKIQGCTCTSCVQLVHLSSVDKQPARCNFSPNMGPGAQPVRDKHQ